MGSSSQFIIKCGADQQNENLQEVKKIKYALIVRSFLEQRLTSPAIDIVSTIKKMNTSVITVNGYFRLRVILKNHIGTVVRISTFGASADLLTDPNVTCMLRSVIPNVTSGNPNLTSGNPKVTWGNPNVKPGIL